MNNEWGKQSFSIHTIHNMDSIFKVSLFDVHNRTYTQNYSTYWHGNDGGKAAKSRMNCDNNNDEAFSSHCRSSCYMYETWMRATKKPSHFNEQENWCLVRPSHSFFYVHTSVFTLFKRISSSILFCHCLSIMWCCWRKKMRTIFITRTLSHSPHPLLSPFSSLSCWLTSFFLRTSATLLFSVAEHKHSKAKINQKQPNKQTKIASLNDLADDSHETYN